MAHVTSRLAKVRARLDLPTVRRASGLLEGRHRSIYTGHGQDFDEMAEYQFGDDISDIDWKASASYGLPVIRRFVRNSNLAMVIAVDTGRNMGATAPAGESKAQIATFAAAVVCFLARGRGDTVALVAGDDERLIQLPARGGTEHMEMLLRRAEDMLTLDSPASNLNRVMDRVLTWFNRRSLVVLITDEARPRPEHEMALKRLRTRHEVMVVQVGDAVPTSFAGAPIDDVDTHLEIPEYLRSDKHLAAEARSVAERRRQDIQDLLRRQDVQGVVADSEDAFVDGLIDLLRRQRRVRR